jgi:hypothetical protein
VGVWCVLSVTNVSCLHRGQNDGLAAGCFLLFVIELPCMTVRDKFYTSGSLAWAKTLLVPFEHRAGWVGSTECLEVMDKEGSPCLCWESNLNSPDIIG